MFENPEGATHKIERKMSHLNITFDPYASIGTVMHYILLIGLYRHCTSKKRTVQ